MDALTATTIDQQCIKQDFLLKDSLKGFQRGKSRGLGRVSLGDSNDRKVGAVGIPAKGKVVL